MLTLNTQSNTFVTEGMKTEARLGREPELSEQ